MDNIFYAADIKEGFYTLKQDESKHLIKVLRKHTGDEVFFTDGKGFFYRTVIVDNNPKHCNVEIVEKLPGNDKRDYFLKIAVAPTKNINRYEWFLEKSTEIGTDEIIPFTSFHSERKEIKYDRLERVIIAAVKQSLKSHKPFLNKLQTFSEVINTDFTGQKFIAYVDNKVTTLLKEVYKPGNNVFILIGPEGDFSKKEVDAAIEKGFVPVSLGPSRLRTETAAIAACHTINLLNL
jgi:16S rRNA (uracil1498-N3)-methyltransferase